MRLSTRAALAALFVLGLAGSAQAGFSIEFPRGPDPAVRAWPKWQDRTACGGGIPFDPVAAFAGETVAETGAGGPEAALREFLGSTPATGLPERYWRLAALGEDRAEFASGRLEQSVYWVVVERRGGEWSASGAGRCRPRSVRDGLEAVSWRLVSDRLIGPGAKSVRVELDGYGCHGEIPLASLVRELEFRQFGRRLVLTVWLEKLTGTYTCPQPIETPLKVRLPGRLGERSLWDGRVYPPRLRQ